MARRALKTRTDAWCLGFATGAGNPSDPHGWSLKLSRLSIVCQSASDRDPGSEVLGPTMQYGCKLQWRPPATMMALATGIIVALLWLREPTTGVHSFGGGSSIHQPVRFPVKLFPIADVFRSHRGACLMISCPWLLSRNSIVTELGPRCSGRSSCLCLGSATPWHAREIQL